MDWHPAVVCSSRIVGRRHHDGRDQVGGHLGHNRNARRVLPGDDEHGRPGVVDDEADVFGGQHGGHRHGHGTDAYGAQKPGHKGRFVVDHQHHPLLRAYIQCPQTVGSCVYLLLEVGVGQPLRTTDDGGVVTPTVDQVSVDHPGGRVVQLVHQLPPFSDLTADVLELERLTVD